MNSTILSTGAPTLEALDEFARLLVRGLKPPLVVYLIGPLGAGKTTFVRALARALGYSGRVKSPTYGLLERYDFNDLSFVHLDLYRVAGEGELEFLALRDLFDDQTVLLIEWPDRGGDAIPPADIEIEFSDSVIDRTLTVKACSAAGEGILSAAGQISR